MKYKFQIRPRHYQLRLMRFIFRVKRAGIFAEMGTGKTKIALDFIAAMIQAGRVGRALVIAPLSALGVWEDEIARNAPRLPYSLIRPNSKVDWGASLLLINYDYARNLADELLKWKPDVVVLDESHKIKSPRSRQSRLAHKLGKVCQYAICLSGTPYANRPLDLWSQMRFLAPDVLDRNFTLFKHHYAIWGGFGGYELHGYKNLDELAKKIAPYVQTLKKSEYLSLPEKMPPIEIPVNMSEGCRRVYKMMEQEFVTYVSGKDVTAPIVLAKLMKLSQIAGGFVRTNDGEDLMVGRHKLDALKELCEEFAEQDIKRVVIFARFLWEIKAIRDILAEKWAIYTISGQVSQPERRLATKLFDEEGGIMLCQIASGSGSLNLQSANHEVFYSWDYSSLNYQQAQDRIHRMGQNKPCFYHHIIARGTLDRRILRILRDKKNISDEVDTLVKEAKRDYSGRGRRLGQDDSGETAAQGQSHPAASPISIETGRRQGNAYRV